jgi:hypothetical protein
LHERRKTILDYSIERRGNKISKDGIEHLSDGKSVIGKDAQDLGIIDRAIEPDVYFYETLPKHDIGTSKPSFKEKLGMSTQFMEEPNLSDFNSE